MTPREAVAYLEEYLAGVADVETWKTASRKSDEAAERWRQGCYLAQGEAAKVRQERDSARLLLKDAERRADEAAARADVKCCGGRNPSCGAEKTISRLHGERDTATAALKSMTDQYREAAAEIERLKAAVARAERERNALLASQRGGAWSGPAGIVISVSGCGRCGFPTSACACWGVE